MKVLLVFLFSVISIGLVLTLAGCDDDTISMKTERIGDQLVHFESVVKGGVRVRIGNRYVRTAQNDRLVTSGFRTDVVMYFPDIADARKYILRHGYVHEDTD